MHGLLPPNKRQLLLFIHPAGPNSLQPQGLQHARPPCPSPSPEVCSSSYSLHQRWHPAISSSDALFSFYSQSFPTSGTFPMRQLFALVSSVAQSCLTLRPHGLQHARPPYPSPTPGVYSNSCPLSRWCHPTISSSAVPFSPRLQSFPASGSFPMSWFFKSGGQSIGISASTSVLPMNIQGWFPSDGLGGFPCYPMDSQESSPTPQFKSISSLLLSFLYSPTLTSIHDYWENHGFD